MSAFVAATTIDPTHAAAYAGLALAKLGQATDRNVLVEAYGEAKAAALRAVALDDKSADAQVALGHVMFTAEWDRIAAERSFQRALAINPNHAEAYIYYGILMEALGDLERGLSLKMQGLECDSTSVLAHLWIAVSCWNQRRYDDVIVWANKALDRDPQHPFARELLVGAHWKNGKGVGISSARVSCRHMAQHNPNWNGCSCCTTQRLETSTRPSSSFNAQSTRATLRCFISPWRPSGTACAQIRASTSVSHA